MFTAIRLIAGEQLGDRTSARLILEINMASFCLALSITTKQASNSSTEGWRQAAFSHPFYAASSISSQPVKASQNLSRRSAILSAALDRDGIAATP